MAKTQLSRVLVVGVDLGSSADWSERGKDVPEMAARISDAMARHQFAATWSLPAGSASARMTQHAIQAVRQNGVGHEFGLRWDDTLHSHSDVFRFNSSLRNELDRCEQLGARPTTLAADPGGALPYVVLGKSGIRTIRPTRGRSGTPVRSVQPQAMRYGIWGVPVSCFWPHPSRLLNRFLQRQFAHQARAAANGSGTVHLVIEASRLHRVDPSLQALECLLQIIAQQRDSASLRIARMCDVRRELEAATVARRPNESILRRAA